MDCATSKDIQESLLGYVAGTLHARDRLAFERHLESCAGCRVRVESQQSVWAALGTWEAAPVSSDFIPRVYARIDEESERSWAAWFRRGWRPALPAAVLCVALMAVTVVTRPVTSPVSQNADNSVEAVDLEQVENTLNDLEMLRQLAPPAVPREI